MADGGGFIIPELSPPPPSIGSPSIRPSLPHPRHYSLAAGSPKEANFVRFVNHSIDRVRKRYANRTGGDEPRLEENGYTSFRQAAEDLGRLVDMIWVSGTRKDHFSLVTMTRRSC